MLTICMVFLFPSIYLYKVSISLVTLSIYYFMLPTFSIRTLNILIIGVLNSLFDISNICVM